MLPSSYIHLLTYNEEVAKDDNADVSTRATAAKDAVSDKAGEVKHSVRNSSSPSPWHCANCLLRPRYMSPTPI